VGILCAKFIITITSNDILSQLKILTPHQLILICSVLFVVHVASIFHLLDKLRFKREVKVHFSRSKQVCIELHGSYQYIERYGNLLDDIQHSKSKTGAKSQNGLKTITIFYPVCPGGAIGKVEPPK
jgi:hypothetical protein